MLKKEVADAQAAHARHVSDMATQLEAREKIVAIMENKATVEREAFLSLELRSYEALCSICGGGYEEPLATPKDDLVGISTKLAGALEGATAKVDPILE